VAGSLSAPVTAAVVLLTLVARPLVLCRPVGGPAAAVGLLAQLGRLTQQLQGCVTRLPRGPRLLEVGLRGRVERLVLAVRVDHVAAVGVDDPCETPGDPRSLERGPVEDGGGLLVGARGGDPVVARGDRARDD